MNLKNDLGAEREPFFMKPVRGMQLTVMLSGTLFLLASCGGVDLPPKLMNGAWQRQDHRHHASAGELKRVLEENPAVFTEYGVHRVAVYEYLHEKSGRTDA